MSLFQAWHPGMLNSANRTVVRRMIALTMVVFLSACNDQSLYSGLSEQEANEMVAELSLAGIKASKDAMKGDLFGVSTSADDFAAAVTLLKNTGLPRQRYDNLGQVFAKEGFVSSPLEERARLNHALSQEIAATLSSIDGVILARVHLAVPQVNDLSDTQKAASASVFVKHRSGVDLSSNVSQIKALVVNGLENLPYDNVTVALFESNEPGTARSSYAAPAVVTMPADEPIARSNQMGMIPGLSLATAAALLAGFGLLLAASLTALRYFRRNRK